MNKPDLECPEKVCHSILMLRLVKADEYLTQYMMRLNIPQFMTLRLKQGEHKYINQNI